METYLEFTDFDDKYYSSEEEDNYSILSSAAKALAWRKHKDLKRDNGYKRVKTSKGKYRRSNALDRLKYRYNSHRAEDKVAKNDKLRDKVEENQKANRKDEIKAEKGSESSIKRKNQIERMKSAEATHKKRSGDFLGVSKNSWKKVGGTAAVGAVGAAAGNIASRKWKKELASLKVKSNPSDADMSRIKTLKRKITAATVAGGVIGAGAGFVATKKLTKK